MPNKFEEYKILIEIYYKEVNLAYTKSTIFISIQLAIFAGVIASYEKVVTVPLLFSIGVLLMISLSLFQVLIAVRANTVNEALINTLSEFEIKNGFTLLGDFTKNIQKINRISKMNFPSYMMIVLSFLFVFAWSIILLITIFPILPRNMFQTQLEQILYSPIIIMCIYSMLFAVTMKISDLLDEHGLRFFKGDSYFFSILCAVFGCLLIINNDIIANIILAMVIGFVIRKRVDYNNHILAFAILTSCFFIYSELLAEIYFPFLFNIILFGFLKDTKYKNSDSRILKIVHIIYLYVPIIYAIPSLIYSMITLDWGVFCVFFTYDFSYNVTRLVDRKLRAANRNH